MVEAGHPWGWRHDPIRTGCESCRQGPPNQQAGRWRCPAFHGVLGEALRNGDKVELRSFGSFIARSRRAQRGRNPRTGEVVQVPARRVPIFRVGQELRAKVRDAGS
ncbi:MAG: integration host factor subunit beta [Candidatus Tectomicrobia bacterium]|nr:integration host factor subunit beta [Candidatus Tectomicrobia bacterium]